MSHHTACAFYGGIERIDLSVYVPQQTFKSKKENVKQAPVASTDPVEQLFEQLKAVRSDISRKQGLPPYLIFSDATLLDMARRHPLELDAMLEVSGVGEAKAAKYGRHFLRRAIRKFDGLGAATPKGTSVKESLILFNAGMSIAEIAEAKGLKGRHDTKSFRRTYRQRTRYLFPQTHQRRRIQGYHICSVVAPRERLR